MAKNSSALSEENNANRTEIFFVNTIFFLSFFCFLQIIPIAAEVQPFSAVIALIFIFLSAQKINAPTVFFVGALIFFLAFSALGFSGAKPISNAVAVETFLALLSPIVIFLALLDKIHLLSLRLFLIVFYFWFFIGFSQSYFPELQKLFFLGEILSSLINRYSVTDLSDYGRGVTLLAPEPSYSAPFIFVFFYVSYFFYKNKKISPVSFGFLSVMIFWLGVMNKSGTFGVMLVALFFISCTIYAISRGKYLLPFAAIFIVLIIGYVASETLVEYRLFEVLFGMLQVVLQSEDVLETLLSLSPFSGQRNVGVIIGFSNLFTGGFWGSGLGYWSVAFVEQSYKIGIDLLQFEFFRDFQGAEVNIKPTSFVALVAFDMGIVGLVLVMMIAIKPLADGLRQNKFSSQEVIGVSGAITSIIFLIISGPISLPANWLSLLVCCSILRRNL